MDSGSLSGRSPLSFLERSSESMVRLFLTCPGRNPSRVATHDLLCSTLLVDLPTNTLPMIRPTNASDGCTSNIHVTITGIRP